MYEKWEWFKTIGKINRIFWDKQNWHAIYFTFPSENICHRDIVDHFAKTRRKVKKKHKRLKWENMGKKHET